MKNIVFRLATLSDVDQLVDLRILMQLEVNELAKDRATSEYAEKVRSYFLKSLADHSYFSMVAVSGSEILGTAGVCFYQKPPAISGGSGLVGYVTNVYTKEVFRGKGIGTELMKGLSELAVKMKADKLHLGATVDGASIYKAVGYKEPRFVNLEIKF